MLGVFVMEVGVLGLVLVDVMAVVVEVVVLAMVVGKALVNIVAGVLVLRVVVGVEVVMAMFTMVALKTVIVATSV